MTDPAKMPVQRWLTEINEAHLLARHSEGEAACWPASMGAQGHSTERTLGLKVPVLDLALGWQLLVGQEGEMGLESWEVHLRHWLGHPPYGLASAARCQDPIAGCTQYLSRVWPVLVSRGYPALDDFAYDIRSLWIASRGLLALLPDRGWRLPCPGDLQDGQLCEYPMRFHIGERGSGPSQIELRCPRCHTTWNIDRLVTVAAAAGRRIWVDAETAAARLGVTTRTVYRQAAEGKIQRRYGRFNLVNQ